MTEYEVALQLMVVEGSDPLDILIAEEENERMEMGIDAEND